MQSSLGLPLISLQVLNNQKYFEISKDSIQACLRRAVPWAQPLLAHEIYLPSSGQLQGVVRLEDFATDWNANLEGYRICCHNQHGFRFLRRNQGQIEWSRPFNMHQFPLLTHQMINQILDFVNSRVFKFLDLVSPSEPTQIICESKKLQKWLTDSFVGPEKPRAVPYIKWPDREVCINLMREHIKSWPWNFEYLGLIFLTLRESSSRYEFEIKNERGSVELFYEANSKNEVLWEAFKWICDYEYYQNDQNFILDAMFSGDVVKAWVKNN